MSISPITKNRADSSAVYAEESSLPELSASVALFLDIDGTLSDLEATPSDAFIPEATLHALETLQLHYGAVALVSGRSIASIDAICNGRHFAASGQHGLEMRLEDGVVTQTGDEEVFAPFIRQVEAELEGKWPGLLIEKKGLSVAVHYRQCPQAGSHVRHVIEGIASAHPAMLDVQTGKCVVELKRSGSSKGTAIQKMMQEERFKGKMPVFAGDDVTDEAGFAMAQQLGGAGIKIGLSPTLAHYHLPDPQTLRKWLQDAAENIRKEIL
jgi:trehalose 6-phosphate phosphatase